MTNENWKPIKGFEGEYEVSDLGHVRSCDKLVGHRWGGSALKKGKVLASRMDGKGYPFVGLYHNGHGTQARVHRLVAEAFIDNPHGLPHVNHIDGDKENPSIMNLEWVTHSENLIHARDVLKRWSTGYHQPRSSRNPKVRAAA